MKGFRSRLFSMGKKYYSNSELYREIYIAKTKLKKSSKLRETFIKNMPFSEKIHFQKDFNCMQNYKKYNNLWKKTINISAKNINRKPGDSILIG